VIPEVQPVVIGVLVIVEVGVFHLRVALAARSRRTAAMLLGAVNAVISVAALGQVLTNLDRPANVIGYAVGVSIGVYLGCVADDRLRVRAAGRAGGSLTQMRRTRLAAPIVDQGGVGGSVQAGRRRRARRGGASTSPGAGR
jgi:Domain of unknown function (DUF5698)